MMDFFVHKLSTLWITFFGVVFFTTLSALLFPKIASDVVVNFLEVMDEFVNECSLC